MEIPKKLKDEIWDYCRVNNISNIDEFNLKIFTQGFTVEKFGATPTAREKIVEKVVEKIVEVEKLVEVPVEKIIEKIVEKEIYITDNSEAKALTDKITSLENELVKIKNDVSIMETKEKSSIKTLLEISNELEKTKQLLEAEKNKNNKRDFYGEK